MRKGLTDLLLISGALSWAAFLGLVVVIGGYQLWDWLEAVRKRRKRIVGRSLPSSRQAQIVKAGSLTAADRFVEEWERKLNHVWQGRND